MTRVSYLFFSIVHQGCVSLETTLARQVGPLGFLLKGLLAFTRSLIERNG